MARSDTRRQNVALALSGGGVRAVAHLGVAEVLRREGFTVEAVAGSSGGALAGVLLCDGYAPREILEIYREVRRIDLVRHSRKGGMFSLDAIEKLLGKYLSTTYLEDLGTDCLIAATDLAQGRMHYFDKGPVAKLAVASSSLIPFFAPVRYGALQLADGGFMDNMPTKPLASRDLPVIGINVNPILTQAPKNVMQTTYRALVLMMAANIEASKTYADAYIEVEGCAAINIFDMSQLDAAYAAGVLEAEKALEKGLLDFPQEGV
jgi:NTE family protein